MYLSIIKAMYDKTMADIVHKSFPGGSDSKASVCNAGDQGSIPGLGRSHMPQSNRASAPPLLSLFSRAR